MIELRALSEYPRKGVYDKEGIVCGAVRSRDGPSANYNRQRE